MADNKNDQVVIALFPSAEAADQAVEHAEEMGRCQRRRQAGRGRHDQQRWRQSQDPVGRKTGKGLAVGAVLGVVAAALGPVGWIGGAVAGGALGGVAGSFMKKSVNLDKEAIAKLGAELDQGQVAVVVACDDFEVGATSDQLAMAGGTVHL